MGWRGQQWTTIAALREAGHHNVLREEEPGLTSIGTEPAFAIGQRALLVQSPAGNVLWDCISYLDEETAEAVRALGGVQAIAISHPHFYASCIEWSEAFDNAPLYLHAADREWAAFPHPNVDHWEGDSIAPVPGLTLLRLGGHFDGAAVLHWPEGAGGRGVILSGDTVTVVMDREWVSFMYSYPNLIPLSEATIRDIVDRLRPYAYERVYGAWPGRVVRVDGARSIERSAERYIEGLRTR